METVKLVPFRPDQPPRLVVERFPGAEASIDGLWRQDHEFREICRDYRETRASIQAISDSCGEEDLGRRRDLVELLAELESEMVAVVERRLGAGSG